MLKATTRGNKGGTPVKIIVLGLSHVNLARLKHGQPIKFAGDELGLPGVEFLIFAGDTEQSMGRKIAELIGPETKTKIDPRVSDA